MMKIAPSILGIDIDNIQEEVNSLFAADKIHLDIMDGQFVDNISFSCQDFEPIDFPVPIEVHLMVENPEDYFEEFMNIGVIGITCHIENTGFTKAEGYLKYLREHNVRAGLALDSPSNIKMIPDELFPLCDQILLMGVKAGHGGQKFIPETIEKIEYLRSRGFQGEIEVDGGVNQDTIHHIADAGANSVVTGSALMSQPKSERPNLIATWQEY